MPDYEVTIKRVIVGTVRVSAKDAIAAKYQIIEYGVAEAFVDYPLVKDLSDTATVRSVKPV